VVSLPFFHVPTTVNIQQHRSCCGAAEYLPTTYLSLEECTMISKELLDILACPQCKGELTLTPTNDGLICQTCKLLYEIRDDIPIMLIDEAKKID